MPYPEVPCEARPRPSRRRRRRRLLRRRRAVIQPPGNWIAASFATETLEPLGVDQGIDEIDRDDDGHDPAEYIIEQHLRLTSSRRRPHKGSRRRKSRRRKRSSGNRAPAISGIST